MKRNMGKRPRNKPLWKEKKISKEEKDYRYACALMESVDCVIRFERKVLSLQGAAKIFERLGDYKESQALRERCLREAAQEQEQGTEQTYEAALRMQEEAKTKLDYKTVIAEYGRVADYRDAAARTEECKKKIVRMETISAWKHRAVALIILALLFAVFWVSPAQPYVKGIIHRQQGKYQLAAANFEQAGSFINSEAMVRSCRYRLAKQAYEQQQYDKALQLCRKAAGRDDADKMAAWLEGKKLSQASVGQRVRFGQKHWVVLDKQDSNGTALLLLDGGYRSHIYNKEQNEWQQSWIREWLMQNFRVNVFNSYEKKMLQETVDGEIYTAPSGQNTEEEIITDKVFLLNEQQYTEWQDKIPAAGEWWLKSSEASSVIWVDAQMQIQKGSLQDTAKNVRPAVWVVWDENKLEELGLQP